MKKAGDLLRSFFDEGVLNTAQGYSEFFSGWKKIVGDQLGVHTRIAEIERNIIVVEADHPGWIQLLQLRQRDILKRVQSEYPDFGIIGISIRLRRDRIQESIQPSPPRRPRPDEQTPEPAQERKPAQTGDPYERIPDEALKETFKRLERGISERNQGGTGHSR